MQFLKNFSLYIVVIFVVLLGCSKNTNTTVGSGPGPGPGPGNNPTDTNCIISSISQVNSGTGVESSLSAFYNSNYQVNKLVVYDSVNKIKNFESNFNFITADSVQINPYQYLLFDGSQRVSLFFTKSDISNPSFSDDYTFKYTYSSEGYLATKNLFINGSTKANYSTVYNYTNNQLTGCIMTSPSSGNLKVLEATLSYDNSANIKNWIYTFPDALEGYEYSTLLNFGKHGNNPLKKVVTKIYEPASGSLIDTWTTDYGNYKIDANHYVTSGEATGDLQQGLAAFYGKTNFYYTCH